MSIDRTFSGGAQCAGRSVGIAVDAAEPRLRLEVAVDLEGAADAAIDEVAIGEADVGLEAHDAALFELAAQRRHVAGHANGDRRHRLALERAQTAGLDVVEAGRERRDARRVALQDEEVRPGAVVDDQARLARFEHAVQVHLGNAADDAVGGREDEAVHGGTKT